MKCIYCLENSSSSVSKAHIAPEALIYTETYLQPGIECDGCNRYAGKLESAFVHHNRLWPFIMMHSVPGKRKHVRRRLGHFSREDGTLMLEGKVVSKIVFVGKKVTFHLPDPPEYDNLKFRRGLYHMAFNYIAWKKGASYALRSEFDRVRQYVRYAERGEAWPYAQVIQPDSNVNKKLELGFLDEAPGCVVQFISFVDEFYVDLLGTADFQSWVRQHLPQSTLLFEKRCRLTNTGEEGRMIKFRS